VEGRKRHRGNCHAAPGRLQAKSHFGKALPAGPGRNTRTTPEPPAQREVT
jgi:hypothetical protein